MSLNIIDRHGEVLFEFSGRVIKEQAHGRYYDGLPTDFEPLGYAVAVIAVMW